MRMEDSATVNAITIIGVCILYWLYLFKMSHEFFYWCNVTFCVVLPTISSIAASNVCSPNYFCCIINHSNLNDKTCPRIGVPFEDVRAAVHDTFCIVIVQHINDRQRCPSKWPTRCCENWEGRRWLSAPIAVAEEVGYWNRLLFWSRHWLPGNWLPLWWLWSASLSNIT